MGATERPVWRPGAGEVGACRQRGLLHSHLRPTQRPCAHHRVWQRLCHIPAAWLGVQRCVCRAGLNVSFSRGYGSIHSLKIPLPIIGAVVCLNRGYFLVHCFKFRFILNDFECIRFAARCN